jgi:amphi-Trp domain-containing protein
MSDVKLERKESVSNDEAAEWLSLLSRAFTQGGKVDLPFGPGTAVTFHIPDHVHAEFEVEVEGDEVEIEVEFKWSTSHHPAESAAGNGAAAAPSGSGPAADKSKQARNTKSKRR